MNSTWEKPETVPDVKPGELDIFIVAVQRKEGARAVFGACYLNAFPLHFEWGCNDCDDPDKCPDVNGDGCPKTGWRTDEPTEDDGRIYTPLLRPGDELLGWQPYPVFTSHTEGK